MSPAPRRKSTTPQRPTAPRHSQGVCKEAQCNAKAAKTQNRCKRCVNPKIQGLGKVGTTQRSVPGQVAQMYDYVAKPTNKYGLCYQHAPRFVRELGRNPNARLLREMQMAEEGHRYVMRAVTAVCNFEPGLARL